MWNRLHKGVSETRSMARHVRESNRRAQHWEAGYPGRICSSESVEEDLDVFEEHLPRRLFGGQQVIATRQPHEPAVGDERG